MNPHEVMSQLPWATRARLYAKGALSIVPRQLIFMVGMLWAATARESQLFGSGLFMSKSGVVLIIGISMVAGLALVLGLAHAGAASIEGPLERFPALRKLASVGLCVACYGLIGPAPTAASLPYQLGAIKAAYLADRAEEAPLPVSEPDWRHYAKLADALGVREFDLAYESEFFKDYKHRDSANAWAYAKSLAMEANGLGAQGRIVAWFAAFAFLEAFGAWGLRIMGGAVGRALSSRWCGAGGLAKGSLVVGGWCWVAAREVAKLALGLALFIPWALRVAPGAGWRGLRKAGAFAKQRVERAALSDPAEAAEYERRVMEESVAKGSCSPPGARRL